MKISMSRTPTMGAWIEIRRKHLTVRWWMCRTPRWVRGLKLAWFDDLEKARAVAPHDGCVDWNASKNVGVVPFAWQSHPTMGAWIEIVKGVSGVLTVEVAPHDGCVDWNLTYMSIIIVVERSHPTMGAWIEIALISFALTLAMIVAPHDGCVDWNGKFRGMDFSDVECHIPYRGAWIEMRPTV